MKKIDLESIIKAYGKSLKDNKLFEIVVLKKTGRSLNEWLKEIGEQ